MTEYRRDESGKVYAFGGLIGNRTIDDRRSERDAWDKMMVRRAAELPHRRLSPMQHLALEEDIWGFDSMVRRRLGAPSQRGVWPETMGLTACSDCGRLNDADALLCDQCGAEVKSAPSDSDAGRAKRLRARSQVRPAASALVESSLRGREMVEAIQTCDVRDPATGEIGHIKAGRTRVGARSWLYKLRPAAFVAA